MSDFNRYKSTDGNSKAVRKPRNSTMSPNPEPKPMFRPGAAVEISSDEPGFRGSYYLGTVIKRLCSSSSDSYLVKYKTLVTESSRPLREEVGFSQLRPPPPPESKWVFGMGDEVDVYHNDGWWEAVVTADLGNGRFEVFFGSYKEQMVFSKQHMRIHRDWRGGVWVPQVEEDDQGEILQIGMETNRSKETLEEKFVKGALIEVSSDDDGFEGAWFSATIVEALGEDKFLVEYQNLRTEDDKDFLREQIDTLHIRPCPPEIRVSGGFKLLEEVDCLYNDGWWVGVVSKVLGESRYIVYFKDTKEEMEFDQSEMRLHQEWIDGKWVVASQALEM